MEASMAQNNRSKHQLQQYSIPGSDGTSIPLWVDRRSGWVNIECPDTAAKLWSRKCPAHLLHTGGFESWLARQPGCAGARFIRTVERVGKARANSAARRTSARR